MMKRLLTVTAGGLFAAMAVLPIAAFAADVGTAPAADTKAPAAVTAPTDAKTPDARTPDVGTDAHAAAKTTAPAHETKTEGKHHKVEAKAGKHEGAGHEGTAKAPAGQSSVQPKQVEPGKS